MQTADNRSFVIGAALVAAFVAGCGSTSPVAPTAASNPVQYPSLVGHYSDEALSELQIRYRDTGLTNQWRCDTEASVDSQRDGTFSGGVRSTGGGSREPPCTDSFSFTAEMRPDGTITDLRNGE